MTDLKHLLDRAADDNGRPLETDLDDLLRRARGARRRRQLRTSGIAVVAAGLAAAIPFASGSLRLGSDSDHRSVTPASTQTSTLAAPTSATPSTAATTPLTEEEIVARCASQLAKYNELPRWRGGSAKPVVQPVPDEAWFVVHQDRTTYRSGDVVALGETRDHGLPRLCLIPEQGRESVPVPFERLVPTAEDHELITQVCSEAEDDGRRGTPDVRDATVLVAQRTGNVLIAALNRGPDYFACTIPVVTLSDRVPFETRGPLRPQRELQVGLNTVVVGPKAGPVSSVYYWGNGFLPPRVASISLEIRGREPVRFPVRDGAYAVALEVPVTRILPSRTTLLDAQGRVLHTSPWS